jgi:hypothetical protein
VTVARQTWHDLRSWSPIRWASSIRAKLGLEFASNDHWVPASQGKELTRKVPGSSLSILRPGGVKWVHSYVSRATIKAGHRMEEHVLDAAIAAHPQPAPAQPAPPSGCVAQPLISALGQTPVAGPAIAALLTSVAC